MSRFAITHGCIVLLTVAAVPGCGVRSVEFPDGSRISEAFFGPPSSIECGPDRTVSGTIRSAGLFGTTGGGGFGLSEQMFMCGSGDCHLAIWPDESADLDKVSKRLEAINQLCIEAMEANS